MTKDQKAIQDSNYIKGLIAQGEHQQLDFKFAITDARKIARSLSAFANTIGGKLLIGVKDNGSIAGTRSDEEFHMVEAAAQLYCKPEVTFTAQKWMVGNKYVLEITIPKLKPPFYAKDENDQWVAYTRVADQNIKAGNILMAYWVLNSNSMGTLIEYSNSENILLNHLHKNKSVTANQFARMAHITTSDAETILLKLLSANIIDIHTNEKGENFCVKALV